MLLLCDCFSFMAFVVVHLLPAACFALSSWYLLPSMSPGIRIAASRCFFIGWLDQEDDARAQGRPCESVRGPPLKCLGAVSFDSLPPFL